MDYARRNETRHDDYPTAVYGFAVWPEARPGAFLPLHLRECARNVGYPVSAIFDNAQTSFFAQLWSAELYGYDGSPMYGYASYGTWEFGGEVRMPQGARDAPS